MTSIELSNQKTGNIIFESDNLMIYIYQLSAEAPHPVSVVLYCGCSDRDWIVFVVSVY